MTNLDVVVERMKRKSCVIADEGIRVAVFNRRLVQKRRLCHILWDRSINSPMSELRKQPTLREALAIRRDLYKPGGTRMIEMDLRIRYFWTTMTKTLLTHKPIKKGL